MFIRFINLLIIVLSLTVFIVPVNAHEGPKDTNGGHFYEEIGRYHFHKADGSYEPSITEKPENHFVGPWIFTVVKGDGLVSSEPFHTAKDALAKLTNNEFTERNLAKYGRLPGQQIGFGYKLDWEVGFLPEDNPVCQHNIPEIAGHLASFRGSDYFYGVFNFTASESVRASLHLEYVRTARIWINGIEIYITNSNDFRPPPPVPEVAQLPIKKGNNLLVVKIGRGGSNCGNAPRWLLWIGLKPHKPIRINVDLIYRNGSVVVNEPILTGDLNHDGVVDILDLVLISEKLGNTAGSPSRSFSGRYLNTTQKVVTTWGALKSRK